MVSFLNSDFLLETETARQLFHQVASPLPLIDYHCHISPREILENRRFDNLAELWLGGRNPDGTCTGDHYKWRLMRSNGVPEAWITGDKPPFERFRKFAEALEMAIGNPMYHWCHLELRQFFDYDTPLNGRTAEDCWNAVNERLRNDPDLSVRGILHKANVAMIGTTDDPIDSLEWHWKILADPSLAVRVYPSFRPDRAFTLGAPDFPAYMEKLADAAGMEIPSSVEDVRRALTSRLEFFVSLGCRASDHGLGSIPWRPAPDSLLNAAFRRAMAGGAVTQEEMEAWQTALLLHLGQEYHRKNIVMQIHFSCLRNVNHLRYAQLGPDTGFDMIGQNAGGERLAAFLSALDAGNHLPRTILYSLNPGDNAMLGTLLGCFQSEDIPGKIQHGSAWWFNDTKHGMEEQMRSLASLGLLGNFVGMLTDSRSFLSYARHDYFRRILCNLVGGWVENGEYPADMQSLRQIVQGICYHNARRFFRLD